MASKFYRKNGGGLSKTLEMREKTKGEGYL